MATPNSTRKVAKAARSSSARRASAVRGNRSMTFPISLGVIVLVGILLVFLGRDRRVDATQVSPRLGDHWHAAYGVYLCDQFLPGLPDQRGDARGVHTHEDGIIHIHPSSSTAAGKKANLGDFFYEVELEVSGSRIVLPNGEVWENGRECGEGQPGRVVLARWNSADDPQTQPDFITSDIAGARFTEDRMAFTLAFVPEDRFGEIPKPPSVPTLDNLSDLPAGTPQPGATPPPEATGTTVAGSTQPTAADGGSSTSAGGTATTAAGVTATSGG